MEQRQEEKVPICFPIQSTVPPSSSRAGANDCPGPGCQALRSKHGASGGAHGGARKGRTIRL